MVESTLDSAHFGDLHAEKLELATRENEERLYDFCYRFYEKMSLQKLDFYFDTGTVKPLNEEIENYDPDAIDSDADATVAVMDAIDPTLIEAEKIISARISRDHAAVTASKRIRTDALKRVYGKKIVEAMKSGNIPVPEKQRCFLVRDFVENQAESALSELFLNLHRFKGWDDLIRNTNTSIEDINTLARRLPDMETDDFDVTRAQHIDRLDNRWKIVGGLSVDKAEARAMVAQTLLMGGVTALTGGFSFVGVAASAIGRVAGKKIARHYTHDKYVDEKSGENGDSKGVIVANEVVTDLTTIIKQAKEEIEANKIAAGSSIDSPVKALYEGEYNVLRGIMNRLHAGAQANLQTGPMAEYWAMEKDARKKEVYGGIVGGIAAGLAGSIFEGSHILGHVHNGGVNLDLDGDGMSHIVKSVADQNHHETLRWFLKPEDLQNLHGHGLSVAGQPGIFGPRTAEDLSKILLNPDYRGALYHLSQNITDYGVFTNIFTKGLIGASAYIGLASALDRFTFMLTGREGTGYVTTAKKAIESVHRQINAENATRVEESTDAGIAAVRAKLKPEAILAHEREANILRFEKDFERWPDLDKVKMAGEWDEAKDEKCKIVLVDMDSVGTFMNWDEFISKVCDVYKRHRTAHNRVNLVLAASSGMKKLTHLHGKPVVPDLLIEARDKITSEAAAAGTGYAPDEDNVAVIETSRGLSVVPHARIKEYIINKQELGDIGKADQIVTDRL